jgi:hypothetical protein
MRRGRINDMRRDRPGHVRGPTIFHLVCHQPPLRVNRASSRGHCSMGISSAHVLAVAPDALDAQDALQLWSGPCHHVSLIYILYLYFKKVFSKCKDSLQDGRRLENISWRLAFRELSQNRRLLDGPWPPTPESVSSDDSGGTKSSSTDNSTSSSDSAASPFFHIAPRSREFVGKFPSNRTDRSATQRRRPPDAPQAGLSAI